MKNTSSYIFIAAMAVVALIGTGCGSTAPETTSPPVGSVPPLAASQPAPAVQPATTTAPANTPKLKFVKADSEETSAEDGKGANAVDGDPGTIWHTQWQDASPTCPHEIVIELVPPTTIKGFTYLPRQDDVENGTIKDYEFYVSDDGNDFGQPVSKGSFENSKDKKTATFAPKSARFIKLKALSEVNDAAWTSAAEIGVVPAN
jgi:hypothetical protein